MRKVRDPRNMTAAEIASLTEEEILEMECGNRSFGSAVPQNLHHPSTNIVQNNYHSNTHQTFAPAYHPATYTVQNNNNYNSSPTLAVANASIYARDLRELNFIHKIQSVEQGRDYSIIIDASSSMFDGAWEGKSSTVNAGQQRWDIAKEAVAILAPLACRCDSNGITVYFFSDSFIKYPNIQSSEHVELLFSLEENQIQGGTALAKVLKESILPDTINSFGERAKPETILVITDGVPDDPAAVEEVIIHATRNSRIMKSSNDLSISIILVGDDAAAAAWLQGLKFRLSANGALFDVVDIMHCNDLAHLIQKIFPN